MRENGNLKADGGTLPNGDPGEGDAPSDDDPGDEGDDPIADNSDPFYDEPDQPGCEPESGACCAPDDVSLAREENREAGNETTLPNDG